MPLAGIESWVFRGKRREETLKWVLRRLASESGRLGPRSHHWLEPLRWSVQAPLDRVFRPRGRPLVREKDLLDDDEYLLSVNVKDTAVTKALDSFGWSGPNYISTKKYRVVDGKRQYTTFTWVYRESLEADWQDHMWAFPAYGDGEWRFDIYLHTEPNLVSRPKEHTEGPWNVGDINRVLRDALEADGIEWGKNQALFTDSEWVLGSE